MNLNKVALYLEFIAFTLRYHREGFMSKEKRANEAERLMPPDDHLTPANPATDNGPPPVLSTPLQVMARVELEMAKLSKRERGIVYAWFEATYEPDRVVMTMASSSSEPKP